MTQGGGDDALRQIKNNEGSQKLSVKSDYSETESQRQASSPSPVSSLSQGNNLAKGQWELWRPPRARDDNSEPRSTMVETSMTTLPSYCNMPKTVNEEPPSLPRRQPHVRRATSPGVKRTVQPLPPSSPPPPAKVTSSTSPTREYENTFRRPKRPTGCDRRLIVDRRGPLWTSNGADYENHAAVTLATAATSMASQADGHLCLRSRTALAASRHRRVTETGIAGKRDVCGCRAGTRLREGEHSIYSFLKK